jgi:hypothetical protein
MTRAHPEQDLQRAVVRLLHAVLPADAMWTAIAPLPGSSPRAGAQSKALGLAAGVPDLIIVHHGFTLWIELKAPGGSLSDPQKAMHRQIVAAYSSDVYTRFGTVVVCKSIDEVLAALRTHRMLKREAA